MSAAENTDKEIWRASDSFYAPSIHVTANNGIGINVGGHVFVKPVEEWHRLAKLMNDPQREQLRLQVIEECARVCDQEESDWSEVFMANPGTDLEGHAMSSSMSANNCAKAIRMLNPAFAEYADKFSKDVREWQRKILNGEATAIPPKYDPPKAP